MRFLALICLLLSFHSYAAEKVPFLRFWRGFVNVDADVSRLKERLNRELLPETIRVGAGKGLTAYLPALLPKNRPEYLPVEVALVAYSSKEDYEAIRSTPEGKAYGDLHFVEGMFEKTTKAGYVSKSEVSTPFKDEVVLPVAAGAAQTEAVVYGINAEAINWQEGYAFLQTVKRHGDTADAAIAADAKTFLSQLKSFQTQGRLNAALVLVNRKYLMVLFNFADEKQARDYSRSSLFVPKGFSVYDGYHQHDGEVLEPRRLLNFSFKTGN